MDDSKISKEEEEEDAEMNAGAKGGSKGKGGGSKGKGGDGKKKKGDKDN